MSFAAVSRSLRGRLAKANLSFSRCHCRAALLPLLVVLAGARAGAATANWVDWSTADRTAGLASGTVNVEGASVTVTYSGPEYAFGLTGGSLNYFNPTGPYVSADISNAPPAGEMIALSAGGFSTITFSRPVKDPVIAFVSWHEIPVEFFTQVEVVSYGTGYFGYGDPVLSSSETGFFARGEFHGVVRLPGTFSSITFSHTSEYWHGFTVGVQGGEQLKTLGEKAAELAKSVVGSPYLWNGKGWDYTALVWSESSAIPRGYTYCKLTSDELTGVDKCDYATGAGLDCSGLVMWAYNKAFGATNYQWTPADQSLPASNPIHYPGADGQYNWNSFEVSVDQRQPGDLLFFDWNVDGKVDHVAMYVGGDTNQDVVNPRSAINEIVYSKADTLAALGTAFLGYHRPSNPQVDFQVRAYSPVDIVVTDPEGFTIDADAVTMFDEEMSREVFRQLYYSESDLNGDGDIDDIVYSPHLKNGSYVIRVIPEASARGNDTYSLQVITKHLALELAKHVPISQIPAQGYGMHVNGSNVTEFVPVRIDVQPERLLNNAKVQNSGVVPVAILSDRTFDATTMDPLSGRLGPGGAVEMHGRGHLEDVNGDGALDLVLHFSISETQIRCGDVAVTLTGTTYGGTAIEGRDSVLTPACK